MLAQASHAPLGSTHHLAQIDEAARASDFGPFDVRRAPTIPRLVDVLDLPTTGSATSAAAAQRQLKTLAASEANYAPRADYVTTIISNWKVWVLPQLFNFAVVPVNLRVGFANVIGLVWTVILSIIANR